MNSGSKKLDLWWELSYAQYLTIPRSVMQEMSEEWQEKMADLLEELDLTLDWRPKSGRYWVSLRDNKGRYSKDPLCNYRYPPKIEKLPR